MPTRDELMAGTIAVLLGGPSAEREISMKTGEAVSEALKGLGYSIQQFDPVQPGMLVRLAETKPTAAVIALHGRGGEDGCVQGMLEALSIPYTGSGVLASALAMDKTITKRLVSTVGVPTPEYLAVDAKHSPSLSTEIPFPFPVVVKPTREGSSVGVRIVNDNAALTESIEVVGKLGGGVLVERYVKGREFSVAVLEGEALGTIEIIPTRQFYDYEAKYLENSGTSYQHPPNISSALEGILHELAECVFDLLGCDGVCRADFIVDGAEEPWFIEINTLPGMTLTSLVPKIAAGAGVSFDDLCERLLLGARLKA